MTIHAIGLTTLNNTAKDFRNDMSGLLFGATAARPTGARSGVRYGTPTDTVSLVAFAGTIKPHSGVMDVQTAAAAGPYFYAVTANETFTVSAAHATLARVDIVTIRINDNVEDASGLETCTAHYKAGTAAGSPVAPTPDTTREMVIATIAVPASGGGNPVVSWVAPYAVAAGGIIPVRTNTERDALHVAYPGTADAPLVIWHKADAAFYYNDGTGWAALGADLAPIEADVAALQAAVADIGEISMTPTSVSGTGVSVSGSRIVLTGATGNISINGCFDPAYSHYVVKMRLAVASGGGGVGMTLRASGTNATTAYDRNRLSGVNTTVSGAQSLNAASWELVAAVLSAGTHTVTLDLSSPAGALATTGILITASTDNPMTTAAAINNAAVQHRTATAYDGFSLAMSTAAFTGYITVTAVNA